MGAFPINQKLIVDFIQLYSFELLKLPYLRLNLALVIVDSLSSISQNVMQVASFS